MVGRETKNLFHGFGIRLGTQEIARYNWNDDALDLVAEIIKMLAVEDLDIGKVMELKKKLPNKEIYYTFPQKEILPFLKENEKKNYSI